MHIPKSCSDYHGKLKALTDWCAQEVIRLNKLEDEYKDRTVWERKNQMLIVQQTLFNLMCKDIYPTDSNDVAYAKHVVWVLVNRKRQLFERMETCEDVDALKQMKSTLNQYKRNIAKTKKKLTELLMKEASE